MVWTIFSLGAPEEYSSASTSAFRPYKECELRTQQILMRAKAIDSLGALANKFVHFNGNDIPLFIKDLVNSGKWQLTFGNERNLLFQAMNTHFFQDSEHSTRVVRTRTWTKKSGKILLNKVKKKERVICEFEVDFKKSFSWRSNLSNGDTISAYHRSENGYGF